jgi:general secretion pathway protein K
MRLPMCNTVRGAAIVMAMLLAALVATIAAALLWQQQSWISEHARRRDQVQAQALAMAGVQWARQIVNENAPAGGTVHLGQPWALTLPAMPLENGSVAGAIVDAQSRLNVNDLGPGPAALAAVTGALQRLFTVLALPQPLLSAITDWIDVDDRITVPGGAEDAWYSSQARAGLTANQPIRRVAELLAVRGDDLSTFARLRPYVHALDAPTKTNVNTAPAEVLMALVAGLDTTGAATLIAGRAQKPFASIADFRERLPRPDLNVDETLIDVRSDWFEVTIDARQGDTRARARALLKRSTVANEWPIVVWQVVE